MDTFISVIMPVFNRPQYISKAIWSVLNQTYRNYELTIVDDGSDNLEIRHILEKYSSSPQVKVFYKEHKGQGAAINYGVLNTKGKYVCRLDSDDLLFPNALEVLNGYIKKYPDVDYFYSSRCTIDENEKLIKIYRSIQFDIKKLLKRHIANPFICWKKKSFLDVGGFDEQICYGEDYDLALRMARKFQFKNIKEVLYMARRCQDEDRVTLQLTQMERNKIVEKIKKRAKMRFKNRYKP